MGLIAKGSNNDDFEMVPAGNHLAICYRVIDLGFHSEEWQGKAIGDRPKVRIVWELPQELMNDGRPFSISAKFGNSLNKKAKLRGFLESWRGRPFTDEELGGFNISSLLGVPCLLSIIHEPSKKDPSRIWANVTAAARLPKGMEVPELFNPALFFDMDAPNADVWDLLPEFVQNECKASIHWYLTEKLIEKNRQGIPLVQQSDPEDPFADAPPF